MKITLLGTASGVPVKDRKSSATLVERRNTAVLFDAGEGVTGTLLQLGKNIDSIARIYLSHTHPDHVTGLPMLLQSMRLGGRTRPLSIVCDRRFHVWLHEMLRGMFMVPVDWDFPVQVVSLGHADFKDDIDVDIIAIENAHLERVKTKDRDYGVPAACYSFIVRSSNQPLFLSSDVGSIEDILPHLDHVAAAILECTHIPFNDLVMAMKSHPERDYVLSHIPPELEPELHALGNILQSEFGPRAVFATDGYSFTLPESA